MLTINTKLSEKEISECDNLVSELLKRYIVRDKDNASKDKYNFLVREDVREYVETILYHCRREFVIQESVHVAFSRNITETDREFGKDESIALLRLLQRDKIKTSVSEFAYTRYEDLKDVLIKEDNRKINDKKLDEMLRKFTRLNLISYDSEKGIILIYPSIHCLLPDSLLQDINTYLDNLEKNNDKS